MGISNRSVRALAALATSLLTAQSLLAADHGTMSRNRGEGYAYEGPYVQVGAGFGKIDLDRGGDSDVGGSFTLAGGYRILPWLSAELNFTFLAADDAGFPGDATYFAFTLGPKFFPLGAFRVDAIPDQVQPYGLIQIGGGEFDFDRSRFDEDVFVARFILGIDFWIDEHIGMFVEGGGHVFDEDDIDGVGIFTIGGQYRF